MRGSKNEFAYLCGQIQAILFMESLTFDTTEQLLLIATGVLFIVQALYYFCIYNRIYARSRALKREEVHFSQELPPLSVIITAREECENLRRNLTAVLEQDYPQFEVIVITDGKGDDSDDFLTLMENRYSNLYHSFVPASSRYISRKKLAITLGIKASKYDWLVLTDADCRPESNQWLRLMARNLTSRTQIVLGYSGYERGKGWLHKRVAFDNLFSAMRHLGFALAGKPYMGIGRNLAYKKELFYAQGGFTQHLNLQRGDDDLFVNQAANGENTRVECSPEAIVRMQPVVRAKDWREEKIGYTRTARLYRGAQRYLSGVETCSRLLFHAGWIATVVLSVLHFHWLAAGIALLLPVMRFVMQSLIVNKTAKALNEPRRFYGSLLLFDWVQPWQSLCWKLRCLFRHKEEFMRR